jgi:tetratricopeptide (TPR) repeat protein
MSTKEASLPRGLVAAVLALTVAVLGLGGAILVIKLKPAELSTNATDRTIEVWRQVVAKTPEDDRARVGLGLALLEAGRPDEARGEFEEAIRLNEENWVALMQLGLLVQEEQPEQTVELLNESAEFAPSGDKVAPLVYLGDLMMEQGDLKAAKKAYAAAVGDSEITFDAHLGLARALEALGDDEGALVEYQEAARFNPSDPELIDAIDRLSSGK